MDKNIKLLINKLNNETSNCIYFNINNNENLVNYKKPSYYSINDIFNLYKFKLFYYILLIIVIIILIYFCFF